MTMSSTSPSANDATSPKADLVSQTSSGPSTSAPTKRASRRANTAERRATHNAVERARRETLNSRFLDLAAILPNLAAVRRPSKSAIVNSSIALINNSRRARILAAREVRLLNAENNALRQELNEWRQRNSLPRVEEPIRSSEFVSLINVQVEEELAEMDLAMMNNGAAHRRSFDMPEGQFDDDDFNEDGADEEALISPDSAHPYPTSLSMTLPTVNHKVTNALQQHQQHQQQQHQQQQQQQQLAAQQQQLYEQQKAVMARAQQQQQQQLARYTTPLNQQQPSPPPHHLPQQYIYPETANLFGAEMYANGDNALLFNGQQTWSQKAIAVTPPGSAHGINKPTNAYATAANSAFLSGSPYSGSALGMFKPGVGGRNGSVNGEDDNSSVGDGSSHFSSTTDLNMLSSSPVDHQFAYGANNMMGLGFGMPMTMSGLGMGMTMPPSPPHSVSLSPGHSQPQSRRPSVTVPAY